MATVGRIREWNQTMTSQEAARRLKISIRSVQRLVQQGRLTPTYQPGKTRAVRVFDAAEVEALRAEMSNRPVYPQTQVGALRTRKKALTFRIDLADLLRLTEEGERYGLSAGEDARYLARLGMESELQRHVDSLTHELAAIRKLVAALSESFGCIREASTETTEIV